MIHKIIVCYRSTSIKDVGRRCVIFENIEESPTLEKDILSFVQKVGENYHHVLIMREVIETINVIYTK